MKTLVQKIWDAHVVTSINDGPDVLYIDKHLIHEVTSPQAFAGIEKKGIPLFRPQNTLATADHNVPTQNQHLPIKEKNSRLQVQKLEENCAKYGVTYFGLGHPNQGIVHVIAPELGITLPGMTIVCGDSHTSTHGGFGAIAFGIGTSEVEQVFASQCLLQNRPLNMKISVNGVLAKGVSAKDIILFLIAEIGTAGASGYFIEYCGNTIRALTMEERMTICNMSIEMGARGGLIAPDTTTFDYIRNKTFAPKGNKFSDAVTYWETLFSDENAVFDQCYEFQASDIFPMVTFGTSPETGIQVNEKIPEQKTLSGKKALSYMGWEEGEFLEDQKIGYVFIGSCTNSRIEDLRSAASIIKGKNIAAHVKAYVVPGSRRVLEQAKQEGLDKIFLDAGFGFREPGCSACLGMNEDKIPPGEYCVSTSNRNFEGRQGPRSRTILASPATAAASALKGYVADVRKYISD